MLLFFFNFVHIINGDFMIIKDLKAREILDSRGNPTVEVDVILEDGTISTASVPSGASTGINEALELRDKDKRYSGKGVSKAVSNINTIIKKRLIGKNVFEQKNIDQIMLDLDGTPNKSRLGANAILAVSLAVLKSASATKKMELFEYLGNNYELPYFMANIINGGKHATNNIDFQEFMIITCANSFKDRVQMAVEIFHKLKEILSNNKLNTGVGDEGGFAPDLASNEEAIDYIIKAVSEAGYKIGENVFLALDIAASEFYNNGYYKIGDNLLTTEQMINYYEKLIAKYPIIYLEDPLDQNDWDGYKKITKKLSNIQIVGDDLFVTNKKYLKKGIENKCCNGLIIKMNQIGTITEMLKTINLARENNYNMIISHRSGETNDDSIADLCVGLNLRWIKIGSLSRGERIAKYNRLLKIEEKLTGIQYN